MTVTDFPPACDRCGKKTKRLIKVKTRYGSLFLCPDCRTELSYAEREEEKPEIITAFLSSTEGGDVTDGLCPVCEHFVKARYHYCPICGTALDWRNADQYRTPVKPHETPYMRWVRW